MHSTKNKNNCLEVTDVPALVAIAYAAHRVGDALLKRIAIRQLCEIGIVLRIPEKKGGEHDAL